MSSPIPIRQQQQQGPNLGGRRRRKRRININVKQCMYGMSIIVFIGQCSLFYLHTIRQQQQHVVHHHPSMEKFLKQKQTLEHVIDEHVTDTLHHSLLRNFQVQHDHVVVTQSKKQVQQQPPPQQSIEVHEQQSNHQKKEGLSACLLVNDENPRLPEWLAYHYHMLPLRSLIVAVDPASRSSPQSILDRYSSSSLMDVTIWNDDDYLPEKDGYGVSLHGACDPNDSIGQVSIVLYSSIKRDVDMCVVV